MRSKESAAELEARRRLAVQRVTEGWTQKEVAAFLGTSERAVGMWVAAHHRTGDDGLRAKPHLGRKPFLTSAQDKRVLGWLADKPSARGFRTDLWTARRVAHLSGPCGTGRPSRYRSAPFVGWDRVRTAAGASGPNRPRT
jgi:transposase